MSNLVEPVFADGPVPHRALQNQDVDIQASALIYESWDQRYVQLSRGRFDGSVQEIRFPSFTLIRETSNRVLLQKGCTPKDIFALGVLMSTGGTGYHCGQLLQTKTIALLAPNSEFAIRTPENFDLIAAAFTPKRLVENLDEPIFDHVELENALQHSSRTILPRNSGLMAGFLQRVYECCRDTPECLLIPSNVRQLEEEFYGILIEILHLVKGSDLQAVCPNRDRIVKRLQDYLKASPGDVINIADICGEIGVTRRTLQNATQDIFGVSPQNYLKAIRLNGFRRDLKVRDPYQESIGDVAARWGFWHLSQLAQDYRRLFGELPSQTPCIHIS